MPIELSIQRGPDEHSRHARFDVPVITIGRHASSALLFDMGLDLEVSTRHAEIRRENQQYVISDVDSRNGTWVNGARLRGAATHPLYLGDVIHLGRHGPELRVTEIDGQVWKPTHKETGFPPVVDVPPRRPPGLRTEEWFVNVIRKHTRALKIVSTGALASVVVLGVAFALVVAKNGIDDERKFDEVTAPTIRNANDDAVVLLETTIPGTGCARGCEGTGFSLTSHGLIATNRHVVIQDGTRATSIRLKFANSDTWFRAHVVRVSSDTTADVALLQLDAPGQWPSVVSLSEDGPDLRVGSHVLSIGFPLGTTLRMEQTRGRTIAKTTMTTGSIGKMLHDVFQINAYAEHGSSGSPVFDRHGHVIGIVSGGARGASDEIVYVVPSNRIWDLRR